MHALTDPDYFVAYFGKYLLREVYLIESQNIVD